MRFISPLMIAGFLVTACGTQQKGPAAQPAPSSEQSAALPASAIVRVELDAQGNPKAGSEETRTTNLSGAALTGDALVSSFDAGTAQKVVKESELDKSSSTQSWGWGGGRKYGNNYGYGNNGYGYSNNYGYGYGYTVYYGGSNYGYGYNSYYGSNNNYGYYSYCR